MILFVLEILCSFLIAMSLVFIVIQIKVKFDKSFLIFGISNLLLCSFSAIDIWLQPTGQLLHWTRLQHVIASFFPPFIIWHITLLIKRENMDVIKVFIIISVVFSLLSMTNVMLVPSENEVIGTSFYNYVFVPYILFVMIGLVVTIFKRLSDYSVSQKKILLFYLFGGIFLSVGGILDLIIIITGSRIISIFPNFSIIGILGFCSVVTIVFTNVLAGLIVERESTFERLRSAYKDLEDVQALKELGQSTAIINHEIRNYAVAISGYAEMLKMNYDKSDFTLKMLNRITNAAAGMMNYSKEILEFSKSRVIKNRAPLDFYQILKSCIENSFHRDIDKFKFDVPTTVGVIKINGDWHKLDQAFVNIFKNSLEAGAQNISINLRLTETTLICTIIDDGVGCLQTDLPNFFRAFYTTKKESGGTGLGMCVVRSIIEGHGGRISVYTKNGDKKQHGLGLNLVFPIYCKDTKLDEVYKHTIVFITEGIKELCNPIQIFRNALLNPYVYNTVKEIDTKILDFNVIVLFATPESVHQFKSKFGDKHFVYVLLSDESDNLQVVDDKGESPPVKFCEEFLFSQIINNVKAHLITQK